MRHSFSPSLIHGRWVSVTYTENILTGQGPEGITRGGLLGPGTALGSVASLALPPSPPGRGLVQAHDPAPGVGLEAIRSLNRCVTRMSNGCQRRGPTCGPPRMWHLRPPLCPRQQQERCGHLSPHTAHPNLDNVHLGPSYSMLETSQAWPRPGGEWLAPQGGTSRVNETQSEPLQG